MENKERIKTIMYGIAVGDAIGFPHEFQPITRKITGMKDHSWMNSYKGVDTLIPSGFWTDDTSMSLLLLQSLKRRKQHDPLDQLYSYLRWYENGYMSCMHKQAFGLGGRTVAALNKFSSEGMKLNFDEMPVNQGNGSLMRASAVSMYFLGFNHENPSKPNFKKTIDCFKMGVESSKTTHDITLCNQICGLQAALVLHNVLCPPSTPAARLHNFISITSLFIEKNMIYDEVFLTWFENEQYKNKPVNPTGYVLDTFHTAIYSFLNANNFYHGMLMCANFGGDCDSNCAVYGALAGSIFDFGTIPKKWILKLQKKELINSVLDL